MLEISKAEPGFESNLARHYCCLWCSTCPLVFGCWELKLVLRKKELLQSSWPHLNTFKQVFKVRVDDISVWCISNVKELFEKTRFQAEMTITQVLYWKWIWGLLTKSQWYIIFEVTYFAQRMNLNAIWGLLSGSFWANLNNLKVFLNLVFIVQIRKNPSDT